MIRMVFVSDPFVFKTMPSFPAEQPAPAVNGILILNKGPQDLLRQGVNKFLAKLHVSYHINRLPFSD
jgi:hypothetical protein